MGGVNADVRRWLGEQQDWLQEAAQRLLVNGSIQEEDIGELASLLKDPEGQKVTSHRNFDELGRVSASKKEIRLVKIGGLAGIENLAPRSPLQFGNTNLVVIYGHNGAGKSGYTRILKKASGKSRAAPLRMNVFKAQEANRKCEITVSEGGIDASFQWHPDGAPVEALRGIDIFDSDEAAHYLSKESAASYTPPILAMFGSLASVCDRIKSQLQIDQDALVSKLPKLPAQSAGSAAGKIYSGLTARTSPTQVSKLVDWHAQDQSRLEQLQKRLSQTDPAAVAKRKRNSKRNAEKIIQALKLYTSAYGDEALEQVRRLRRESATKRKAAQDAGRVFSSKMEGIGTESWILLWQAAKAYSVLPYPNSNFPVVSDGARCVLCHQILDTEARQRFGDFERFVEGTLAAEADKAEKAYKDALAGLPAEKDEESIRTICEASGLSDNDLVGAMILFWADAARVRRALLDDEFEEAASPLQELPEIGRIIQQHCDLLEEQAIQCDQDAAGDQRPLLQAEKSELEARLWISQQAAAIEVELARLKAWKQLDDWKSLANSRKVSIKAGEISEKVITEEYVRRFNNELQELGASRLRVGLVKTRAERGRTLHRLQLIGAKQGSGIDAILSEGERRVVSMAAFLADVADKPEPAPFVFDDPISSLDQTWEETTAARLIRLSQTRQVIVFTHRLSMLSQFSDASTVVYIRQEPWGAGETGEVPLFGKAPEKALNDLRLRRLAQADKLFQTDGADASYPLVKAICSDFRILIERFVETHVLAEVVQRHRREVNTKGKLHNLLKLTRTDCELINGLMTKFSRFEHSQPTEAPVELPGIQELSVDMQKLADWYLEFKARSIPAV